MMRGAYQCQTPIHYQGQMPMHFAFQHQTPMQCPYLGPSMQFAYQALPPMQCAYPVPPPMQLAYQGQGYQQQMPMQPAIDPDRMGPGCTGAST